MLTEDFESTSILSTHFHNSKKLLYRASSLATHSTVKTHKQQQLNEHYKNLTPQTSFTSQ